MLDSINKAIEQLKNVNIWDSVKKVSERKNNLLDANEDTPKIRNGQNFNWQNGIGFGADAFKPQVSKYSAEKKDDFLEGFNYYSEEPKKQTRQEKFANIRANADKRDWSSNQDNSDDDPFLQGFKEGSEGFSLQSTVDSVKSKANKAKETVFETLDNVKDTVVAVTQNPPWGALNTLSSYANKKGVLDDITNAGFKASDSFEDSSINFFGRKKDDVRAKENYSANKDMDLSRYEKSDGYINDQESGAIANVRYGNGTLAKNGCGVIAVNNALVSLEDRKDIRDIARDFEKGGLVLSGTFGTNPYAIGDYFREKGYKVDTYEGSNLFSILKNSDAKTHIFSYWNSDKAEEGVHIVSVDKMEDGQYRFYNMKCDVPLPEKYAEELFNGNNIPLILHCIKKG